MRSRLATQHKEASNQINRMDGDALVRVVHGQACEETFQSSPKGLFQGCVLAQTVWAGPHLTRRPSLSCLTDTSCNILTGVGGKTPRKRRLGAMVHHTSVSEDYFIAIKSKLDPSIPKGLINKAWFHVLAHFGCRENKGNRSLKPTLFNIKGDENQPEHATRIVDERTKNHNDPKAKKKGSTKAFVYEMHSHPLKKSVFHLPPNLPAFHLQRTNKMQ